LTKTVLRLIVSQDRGALDYNRNISSISEIFIRN
jgi:hypothetical protein